MEKVMEPVKEFLTANEFKARAKPASKSIHIPSFGDVSIRAVTLKEREEIKSGSVNTLTGATDEASFISLTVLKGMVEPRLVPSDLVDLQQSNFGILAELSKKIWQLSGVGDEVKNA